MSVVKRSWLRVFVLGLAAVSVFTSSGCSDDQHTTGTVAEKAPGADAGEKKSMDAMKSMMKSGEVKGVNKSK